MQIPDEFVLLKWIVQKGLKVVWQPFSEMKHTQVDVLFTVLLVVHSFFLWLPWHYLLFICVMLCLCFKLALTVIAPLWVFSLTFDLWWPPSQFSGTCLPQLNFCAWENESTNTSRHCSPLSYLTPITNSVNSVLSDYGPDEEHLTPFCNVLVQ